MRATLRAEIPMNTLQDLRAYHQSQVDRHQRLANTRDVVARRYEKSKLQADLSHMEFHQRIVSVIDEALRLLPDGRGSGGLLMA